MDNIEELIDKYRNYVMSDEERKEQDINFAYGNAKLSNKYVTREMIENSYNKMHNQKEAIND